MKRVLALVVAVAMVLGAVAIRRAIDDDGSPGSAGGVPSGPIKILCATELLDACNQLVGANSRLTVVDPEPAGATADRLARDGATLGADAWLVPQPWPAIVAARRSAAGLDPALDATPAAVGAATLNLAIRVDQLAPLQQTCKVTKPTDISWGCLATSVGQPLSGGQRLTVGVAPSTSSASALTATALVGGVLGSTAFGTNDLSDDDRVLAMLRTAGDSRGTRPDDPDPVTSLTQQPVSVAATGLGGLAAELATTPLKDVTALAPTPVVAVDAVVIGVAGRGSAAMAKAIGESALREAMRATGWGARTGQASNLPEPAVTDAVTQRWKDITG